MKLYLSGAIDNNPDYFEEFEDYEKEFVSMGFDVVNPCKLPHQHNKTWASYIIEDLKALEKCDKIFYINDISKSYGGRIEKLFAEKLGITELLPFKKQEVKNEKF